MAEIVSQKFTGTSVNEGGGNPPPPPPPPPPTRSSPAMSLDLPAQGTTTTQPFPVAGWAVDLAATSDTGVSTVHAWAFPSAGGNPVFLGAPSYGGARADVAAYFQRLNSTNSGFNGLAGGLAPGQYTVRGFAYSKIAPEAVFMGVAAMDVARPDVRDYFGATGDFTNAGFSLNAAPLPAGVYEIVAFGYSTVSNGFVVTATRRITVY